MRVDNLSNFTSGRLSEIIEQRFGQKVELDTLDDGTLDMFKDSISGSMKQFETAQTALLNLVLRWVQKFRWHKKMRAMLKM